MNAAEDDHLGLDLRPFSGELEAVADEVRDLEDLRSLIVVGENDRVSLAFQLANRDHAPGDLAAPLRVVRGISE